MFIKTMILFFLMSLSGLLFSFDRYVDAFTDNPYWNYPLLYYEDKLYDNLPSSIKAIYPKKRVSKKRDLVVELEVYFHSLEIAELGPINCDSLKIHKSSGNKDYDDYICNYFKNGIYYYEYLDSENFIIIRVSLRNIYQMKQFMTKK